MIREAFLAASMLADPGARLPPVSPVIPPPPQTCRTTRPTHVGNVQAYQSELVAGRCVISVHPMAVTNMVYRDYAVFDGGLLMVFNSYGEAEGPTMHGAREFYFFPRTARVALTVDHAAKRVSARMSDGGTIEFDTTTGDVASLDRGSVRVAPTVDRSNQGGVEITGYQGLMLDAGFRLGESPSGRPNAQSEFRTGTGQTCRVTNSEIFAYANGEHDLKFDDAQLSAFLRTRCPNLTLSF